MVLFPKCNDNATNGLIEYHCEFIEDFLSQKFYTIAKTGIKRVNVSNISISMKFIWDAGMKPK